MIQSQIAQYHFYPSLFTETVATFHPGLWGEYKDARSVKVIQQEHYVELEYYSDICRE